MNNQATELRRSYRPKQAVNRLEPSFGGQTYKDLVLMQAPTQLKILLHPDEHVVQVDPHIQYACMSQLSMK